MLVNYNQKKPVYSPQTGCTLLLLFLLSIFQLPPALAQGFLKAEGKKIVDEKGENVLLRGIGLGGWMLQEGYMLRINKEAQQYRIRERISELAGPAQTKKFYDTWLTNHTRKPDIDSLKAWGFNSVRLPMHYNLYTLAADQEPVPGKNTWIETGFALTDSLLAWCKANRMYLILDLHAAPGGQGNDLNISDRDPSKPSLWENRANQEKMIALWKKLAERYASEPWIGAYDIINEPNWGFSDLANDKNGTKEQKNEPLQKLLKEATKAIREVDKNHLLIIEGNGWGNNYNGIVPDWDDNMALSFHKYWNFNNQASLQNMLKMRDQYNKPIWLGETGENSNVWFTQAIQLLESNNIGWAWWPLKKLGINNPMEIRSNPDYDLLVNYLNGQAGNTKPDKNTVIRGLNKLAEDLKQENTIVHRDVLDAMFRQPFSTATKPFREHRIAPGSIINAVDYDLGRNGFAYFDQDTADYHVSTGKRTAGNRGRQYRNDGVDISKDSSDNRYYVSDVERGEWLNYTINVLEAGKYTVQIRVAAEKPGGRISLSDGKTDMVKDIDVPATGSSSKFSIIGLKNISLNKGVQTLRFTAGSGEMSLSEIKFGR